MCHCHKGDQKGSQSRLGIKAKSSPTSIEETQQKQVLRALRKERFELSRIARGIFAKQGEKEGKKYVLNYHRAAKCAYIAIGEVAINKSIEYEKAFFTGIMTCGSVWACPNCAAKVQERRRAEISTAMDHMYQNGRKAVMVTLTFPHTMRNNLKGLLDAQKEAFKFLRKGRSWDLFKGREGYAGLIRSLEVTFGENGWHPHTHELWFVDSTANAEYMKSFILRQWESACIRAGLLDPSKPAKLRAFRKHSVDVKDNCSTSDYLAKQDDSRNWGVDREIAKASSKKGKKAGMHPFGFLTKYNEERNSMWARRWIEYNEAIKGKAQLFWSRGLKDLCGLNDVSDEELAVMSEDEATEIMKLTQLQWNKIANSNTQALVLDTAEETSNKQVIEAVIENSSTTKKDVVTLIRKRMQLQDKLFSQNLTNGDMEEHDHHIRYNALSDEELNSFVNEISPSVEPEQRSMKDLFGRQ